MMWGHFRVKVDIAKLVQMLKVKSNCSANIEVATVGFVHWLRKKKLL